MERREKHWFGEMVYFSMLFQNLGIDYWAYISKVISMTSEETEVFALSNIFPIVVNIYMSIYNREASFVMVFPSQTFSPHLRKNKIMLGGRRHMEQVQTNRKLSEIILIGLFLELREIKRGTLRQTL